jgi:hypothetical protein
MLKQKCRPKAASKQLNSTVPLPRLSVNWPELSVRSGKCEHVRDILIRLGVIKEDA